MKTHARGLVCLQIVAMVIAINQSAGQNEGLREQFDRRAANWEKRCDEKAMSSNLRDLSDHDSFRELVMLGRPIVPLIFERWKVPANEREKEAMPWVPWWLVLESVTGKKMVSDAERLADLPPELKDSNPERIRMPVLEEKRWREWWEKKGKREFNVK